MKDRRDYNYYIFLDYSEDLIGYTKGTPEYQTSLVIDNLLNIERRKK